MKIELDKVYHGDCIEIMKQLPDECVDLIFADPPFNIGVRYDKWKDNLKYEEYLQWSESWLKEAYRLLKKNGSIYVAIGDEFAAELAIILKRLGLYMRNWIIWYYSSSSYRKIFHRTRFRRQGDYKLPCEPQENIPRTYYVRISLIPTP